MFPGEWLIPSGMLRAARSRSQQRGGRVITPGCTCLMPGGTPSSAGCHLFFPALERQNFHFRSVPSSLCSVLAEAELHPHFSAHARSIPAKCSLCPSAPNRCPRPPGETLNKYIFCSAQPRQSERLFKNQEEKMPRQQCP